MILHHIILSKFYYTISNFQLRKRSMDDNKLILWALTSGNARWEKDTKELCFNSIRYACDVDEFGIPVLSGSTQADLKRLFRKFKIKV